MEWISVKESAPVFSFEEYCKMQDGDMSSILILIYDGQSIQLANKHGDMIMFDAYHPGVTHWMPLPEPPKQ